MDFHPWIRVWRSRESCGIRLASMLPWIFIHGYYRFFSKVARKFSSFNVAMDFHPWILLSLCIFFFITGRLQCCHGFSSMDTEWNQCIPRDPDQCASMLPWIFIHGYVNDVVVSSVLLDSFNVAMDFHPWIRIASEEYPPEVNELQCCHGFSSMDTSISDMLIIICSPASMLPWIFIHGYLF